MGSFTGKYVPPFSLLRDAALQNRGKSPEILEEVLYEQIIEAQARLEVEVGELKASLQAKETELAGLTGNALAVHGQPQGVGALIPYMCKVNHVQSTLFRRTFLLIKIFT